MYKATQEAHLTMHKAILEAQLKTTLKVMQEMHLIMQEAHPTTHKTTITSY